MSNEVKLTLSATSNEKYGIPMTCRISADDAFEIQLEAKKLGQTVGKFNSTLLLFGWKNWKQAGNEPRVETKAVANDDRMVKYSLIQEFGGRFFDRIMPELLMVQPHAHDRKKVEFSEMLSEALAHFVESEMSTKVV